MKIGWSKQKEKAAAPATARPAPARSERRPARPPLAEKAVASFEEMLVQKGALTLSQLNEALEKQKDSDQFLGQTLVDGGYMDEDSLVSFLAKHCKVPHLSILDYLISDDLFDLVPKEVCAEYRILPLDKMGKNLTLAMVNPLNQKALEKARECCPDLRIKPILCSYSHYQRIIEKITGQIAKGGSGIKEVSIEDFGLLPIKPEKTETAPEPKVEAVPVAVAEEVEVTPVAIVEEEVVDGDAAIEALIEEDGEPDPHMESSGVREMVDAMRNSMRETYELLARRFELFAGLSTGDLAKIFAKGITVEFEAGATIFSKGDEGDIMYVVVSGSVDVHDGDVHLGTVKQGGVLGEMAWLSDDARSATATATETSSLITLSEEIVRNALSKDAAIQLLMNIILIMSQRLREANDRQR